MNTDHHKSLVSVLILTRNRKSLLCHTLQELKKQTYKNMEIIVVDNNSLDGTSELIKKEFPEVNLIQLHRNFGIEGYNIGFKSIKGKYTIILDDDAYLKEDALEKVVAEFEKDKDKKIGALAFCIYVVNDNGKIIAQDLYGLNRDKNGDIYKVESVIGAATAVRTDVLQQVGFYSTTFFLYENDYDLSIKIYLNGYELKYCKDIIAYHRFANSPIKSSWRKKYYGQRNNLMMIYKFTPFSIVIRAVLFKLASIVYKFFSFKNFLLDAKILYDSIRLYKKYFNEYKIMYQDRIKVVRRFRNFYSWIRL